MSKVTNTEKTLFGKNIFDIYAATSVIAEFAMSVVLEISLLGALLGLGYMARILGGAGPCAFCDNFA